MLRDERTILSSPAVAETTYYTAGLGFSLSRSVYLDVAYCYVSSADPERTGSYPVYDYTSGDLASVFTRNYKLHAHVLSFGMRFNF